MAIEWIHDLDIVSIVELYWDPPALFIEASFGFIPLACVVAPAEPAVFADTESLNLQPVIMKAADAFLPHDLEAMIVRGDTESPWTYHSLAGLLDFVAKDLTMCTSGLLLARAKDDMWIWYVTSPSYTSGQLNFDRRINWRGAPTWTRLDSLTHLDSFGLYHNPNTPSTACLCFYACTLLPTLEFWSSGHLESKPTRPEALYGLPIWI